MRKLAVYALLGLLLCSFIKAEDVEKKFSIGLGTGLFKDVAEDDYRTIGNSFFWQVKYGILKDLEVGIRGGIRYNYPGANLVGGFPWPTKNSESGEEYPKYTWDAQHIENPYTWAYGEATDNRGLRLSFDRCENCNQKYVYYPFMLFFHFRAMRDKIFNPYLSGGIGVVNWKVVDDETGELLKVKDAIVEEPDSTTTFEHPGRSSDWVDFKGTFYSINIGLGFEVFPIENVGIDVGLEAGYAIGDKITDAYLDTIYIVGGAYTRLTFYYGGVRDADKDGVPDHKDRCPDTPFGAIVDEFGCPLDSDQDGIFDGLDECPNTHLKANVDAKGCPLDSDYDGVPDGVDRCTETPKGAKVDTFGCPKDDDEDGVPNYKDECPNTPVGALVRANGCPIDNDADGVYDGIDECPRTPTGRRVDSRGCAIAAGDIDHDGVSDDVDRCPGTPQGAWVDTAGCPKDSDGDNVPDGLDKCPNTPEGARVNYEGCKMEEKEVELVDLGRIRLNNVNFDFNKASIRPGSNDILNEVGEILNRYPMLKIEIGGHTDSQGSQSFNQELSEKRAQAVLEYLLENFPEIDRDKFVVKGYGESQPLDSNTTEEGRQLNRRVEFKVLNKDKIQEMYQR